MSETAPAPAPAPSPIAGWFAFALGAASLILVLVHFWSGPFAPQQSTGVSIGELAGEIKDSAIRSLKGEEQPAPVAAPWDIDRVLKAVAAVLTGGAVILGLVSILRHEPYRIGTYGAALGIGAILFQLFTWTIMAIIGGLIIIAIVESLGLSGIFDGFGG